MDAVGFVASVVALVQGAGALLEYVKDMKDGPSERAGLQSSLVVLRGLLHTLKDQFDNPPPNPPASTTWATATSRLAVADGPFVQLSVLLQRVQEKLETPATRIGQLQQKLKWTLDKTDVAELLIKVERVKSLIILALQNDHVALSREIRRDVQLLHQQVGDVSKDLTLVSGKVEDVVRDVSRTFQKIDGVVQDLEPIAAGVKQLQDHDLNADLRAFAQWLSPLDFEATQENFFSKCAAGTGDWFINHPGFQHWISGDISLLWCPGKPGVGKTILSSRVNDYLRKNILQPGIGVTYIFFDYNQSTSQTPAAIMGSMIRQLMIDSPSIPESVKSLHALFTSGRTRRSGLSDLVVALKAQLQLYSRVYLVVDALDECSGNRDDFIAEIRCLMDTGHLQVLITARDISAIGHKFTNDSRINVLVHNEDVCSYITQRIRKEERLQILLNGDISLEQEIVAEVTNKAAGMFLLVRLHMDTLASKNNRKALRDALAALPKEIYRSYDDVMSRIDSQGPDDSQLARKLFLWLAHAKTHLSMRQIQYAIAISPGMLRMDLDAITSVEILTAVCAGLVIIEDDGWGRHQLRFVHYTTQQYFQLEGSQKHFILNEIVEYFQLPRDLPFPFADFSITTTCITYLCFQDINLLDYSDAAENGHHGIVEPLLQNNGVNLNTPDCNLRTPLSYAAENGHQAVVELLLQQTGLNTNTPAFYSRTPLSYAAENGHQTIVELLLQRDGVDPNTCDFYSQTHLSYAAENGHHSVVELLLQQDGVNPNIPDSDSRTPLSYAAENGHHSVVELLLKHPDIQPNLADCFGVTPLMYSASKDDKEDDDDCPDLSMLLLNHPDAYEE
ncbi:hypothetical protein C8R44DRAFT_979911 [Mycena epipterygia]|nr:hypothetical protein C8R44DRAFT_979911 [Mycena epipterygia]